MINRSILDLRSSDLTPGMKQYQEAKRLHPDCIIMLRMGDFYEMFYEDAITAAKELEITLTARGKGDKRAPLAGIPYHALEPYLGKFIKKGFKVAIVEQLEDPKTAKGLVKRGIVRIITPGTVIDSSMLNEKENNYIAALTSFIEDYSLAFCDLSTGEFITKKITGTQSLLHELLRLQPSECLIPESLLINQELIAKIKSTNCFLNTLDDYYFKTDKAREVLLQHFNLSSLDNFGLEEHKSNLAVSGALLKYLIETQKNSLTHLKKVSLQSNQEVMLLDSGTLKNLELIRNIKDNSSRGTLLAVIDHTVTSMGARLLRRWLKTPLLNRAVIQKRLDSIDELNHHVIIREEIILLLKGVYDLERLISRVNYGNAHPKDLLALKSSLRQIPMIKEKLSFLQSQLLREITSLAGLENIALLLEHSIREDAPLSLREGNMIKPEFNPALAQLHEIKKNSRKYLQLLEDQEKERTGISTLRIAYNRVFGYFIEVTKKNIHLIPNNYIRKQTTANSERYITEELKNEEEKILGAQEKIQELEYNLFQEIITEIATKTIEVQETAAKLAVLDVLCSLAQVAMENNYTKPQLVDTEIIQIKNGRHPVVETTELHFIANDLCLNQGEMIILTGPNMAGKSTIMRQTALIQLLAQMGSFVPAEEAVLGIVDRIFTRVGAYDDLSSGQSTFMIEMNETASILNNATSRSLIILDEIGRGTSTFDGVSIAWSVAEHIFHRIKAKTLFATHYHILNKLGSKFEKIKNYNLAIKEIKGEVIFLRKLISGGTDKSYGIHVAKLAGLPSEVLLRAKEIQELLQQEDEMIKKIKAKTVQEQTNLNLF